MGNIKISIREKISLSEYKEKFGKHFASVPEKRREDAILAAYNESVKKFETPEEVKSLPVVEEKPIENVAIEAEKPQISRMRRGSAE